MDILAVHAAVQPRPGARLTALDVIAFWRQHLAGYKVPREVTFHDDFPRDAAGKLSSACSESPTGPAGQPAREPAGLRAANGRDTL